MYWPGPGVATVKFTGAVTLTCAASEEPGVFLELLLGEGDNLWDARVLDGREDVAALVVGAHVAWHISAGLWLVAEVLGRVLEPG